MGVKFKGHSEYESTYKWKDSIKSASFNPAEELTAQEAGKPSYQAAYVLDEPPLQHKRRIPDPYVTEQLLETTNPREIDELLRHSPTEAVNAKVKKQMYREEAAGAKTKFQTADPVMSKTYQVSKDDEQPKEQSNKLARTAPKQRAFSPPKAPRLEKHKPVVEYPHPNAEPYEGKEKDAKTKDVSFEVSGKPDTIKFTQVPKVRARVSEYKRQFPKWDNFPKSKPSLDNSEVVFKSHTGIPPYATDNVRRSSEYQKEFKDWSASLARSKSLAARPRRTRDDIGIALSGSRKKTEEADMRLVQPTSEHLPPEVTHFPMRKHRSEYSSSFRDVSKYDSAKQKWVASRVTEPVPVPVEESGAKVGWASEVSDLRQKAAYYGARHLGTHISRDHLGQLIAKSADKWDDPGSPDSARVLTDALDLAESQGKTKIAKTTYLDMDRPAGLPSKLASRDFDPSRRGVIPPTPITADEVAKPIINGSVGGNQTYVKAAKTQTDTTLIDLETQTNQEEVYEKNAEEYEGVTGEVVSPCEKEPTVVSSSRSSEDTPRQRFGLRNTLELGRVPTPEITKTVNNSKSLYPRNRHHLDRTTVIKAGSDGEGKKLETTKLKQRTRPNSARAVVKSSEEHFLYPKPQASVDQNKKVNKPGKTVNNSVHPPAKVDSWIVRSPRTANTQYTRTVAKSFGCPTGDTHEIILNTSSASSNVATPVPFSTAVIQKHSGLNQKNMTSKPRYVESAEGFPNRYRMNVSNNADEDALRLPLDFTRDDFSKPDDLDKLSVVSLASSRSLASDILEKAKNRRDVLRVK